MKPDPANSLTREEFDALKMLAGGLQATAIAHDHLAKLSGLALIERRLMKWRVTSAGLTCLRKGCP
jgi:hypothetical protein